MCIIKLVLQRIKDEGGNAAGDRTVLQNTQKPAGYDSTQCENSKIFLSTNCGIFRVVKTANWFLSSGVEFLLLAILIGKS